MNNEVFTKKYVKILHKEVKHIFFTKKIRQIDANSLSGMHQNMASKIGISFFPREKSNAKIQCHPLSEFSVFLTEFIK